MNQATSNLQTARFRLDLENRQAIFSLEPEQTRMATCYRDGRGMYHLFADHMTTDTISWNAEIRHYRSANLHNWEYVGIAVPRGTDAAPDAYGAASPHVLATDERIYLFYAGRGKPCGGVADTSAPRGQTGYVAGCIMLASAKTDENGAPAENFSKHGTILAPGDGWDAMRLDDPCAVLENNTVHLFFKGFDSNRDRNHVQVGYATARLPDMAFGKHPAPILAAPGGGEMPRAFRQGEQWHLFYHHFGEVGTCWRHHVGKDPKNWQLADNRFFDGHPGDGPRDLMLVYTMNGKLPDKPAVLVAGSERGYNKLWLYRLAEKK